MAGTEKKGGPTMRILSAFLIAAAVLVGLAIFGLAILALYMVAEILAEPLRKDN